MVVTMTTNVGLKSNLSPDYGQHRKCVIKKMVSELPNVPERLVYSYTVNKSEKESFGISIVGGIGSLLHGIYVKSVSPNSACGRNGNIQVGDQILLLNGHCLRETTHDQAVTWFRESRTKMDVVISRMVESKIQKDQAGLSPYQERLFTVSQDRWSEEPIVLEHKCLYA